ncbi:MAG: AI-2E family transporter [Desulfobacteraceae bacterium]|nr:MAG: AI-2E family transporter [Desulfobacteraceae bacterium]
MNTLKLFTRENLFALAFFFILVTLLWLVVSILSPFLPDFIWALIISMTFYPVYERVIRIVGSRANLSAFIVTGLVMVVLILPGFFILMNLTQEAKGLYETLTKTPMEEKTQWIIQKYRTLELQDILERWGVEPEHAENLLRDSITEGLRGLSKLMVDKVSNLIKNFAAFSLHVLFVVVAIFFFFRDGARYARFMLQFLPLEPNHQETVVSTFSRTVSAVMRGMFVTALVQGILAGAGFAVAGLPVPILLGVMTFITSFIPFLGAASVWVLASIWLLVHGQLLAGFGLALYGALIISSSDNIIKPLLIGEGTKLPVFLLFFTILGGLNLYGFLGIFLGPIILSLGMAFLTIYRTVYLEKPLEGAGVDRGEGSGDAPPDSNDRSGKDKGRSIG